MMPRTHPSEIRAILFDKDGTLVDFNRQRDSGVGDNTAMHQEPVEAFRIRLAGSQT